LDTEIPVTQALKENPLYWELLKSDVVASARNLAMAYQASGQWWDNFGATIEEGNENDGWGDPPEQLHVVGLVKDVDICWSSIF
jgi:hypothetical protein